MSGQFHVPAPLPPRKWPPVSIGYKSDWAPDAVWTVSKLKILYPTGISNSEILFVQLVASDIWRDTNHKFHTLLTFKNITKTSKTEKTRNFVDYVFMRPLCAKQHVNYVWRKQKFWGEKIYGEESGRTNKIKYKFVGYILFSLQLRTEPDVTYNFTTLYL